MLKVHVRLQRLDVNDGRDRCCRGRDETFSRESGLAVLVDETGERTNLRLAEIPTGICKEILVLGASESLYERQWAKQNTDEHTPNSNEFGA